jgi:flagellar basal body-associated protein FliL
MPKGDKSDKGYPHDRTPKIVIAILVVIALVAIITVAIVDSSSTQSTSQSLGQVGSKQHEVQSSHAISKPAPPVHSSLLGNMGGGQGFSNMHKSRGG